jgi:NAD+ diphosphatase
MPCFDNSDRDLLVKSPIHYSSGPIDRAAKLRADDDWVSAAFVSDAAMAVLIHNDRNLVTGLSGGEDVPHVARVPLSVVRPHLVAPSSLWTFLGLDGETPVFAAELPADALPLPEVVDAGEFVDLRRVGPLVTAADAATMAYTRAMIGWQKRHRYCSMCGSPTESRKAGHVRRCTNPDCAAEWFPRTDPVVIMRVTLPPRDGYPERCLMGRHNRLPPGAYSVLAGFVEPGESLEDAVAREVWEETGVRVRDVRYEASQPWPFPYSMMMGFSAIAETDGITIDGDELEDARWFSAAELAAFGEWGDESATFRKPRRDSIARALVDEWVAEQSPR